MERKKYGKLPANWKKMPLLDLTEAQREAAFAEIGLGDLFGMLQDARRGIGQEIILAVAELELPDGSTRVVAAEVEAGDGVSTEIIRTIVENANHFPACYCPANI